MSSRLTTVDRSEAANVDPTVKNSKRRREAMVVMETATGYHCTVGFWIMGWVKIYKYDFRD